MKSVIRLAITVTLLSILLVVTLPSTAQSDQNGEAPPSVVLIEQAYQSGRIDYDTAIEYKVQSIFNPRGLPVEYQSTTPVKCATPILIEVSRNWQVLRPETKDRLSDYPVARLSRGLPLLRPPLSGSEFTYSTTHFQIHYTKSGVDAVNTTDSNFNGIPDYIESMGSELENVWTTELSTMGWLRPPSDASGDSGNSDFDVYVHDMIYYGYTQPEDFADQGTAEGDNENSPGVTEVNAVYGYIGLENDYVGFPLTPLNCIKVTAAHEFNHAIQFGYDYFEETWLMEATATWMEDEVYDAINDNLQYLSYYFDYPDIAMSSETPGLHWYGDWIFPRYISERHGGQSTVRSIWENSVNYSIYNTAVYHSFDAIQDALSSVGTSLAAVFNNFTVANYVKSTSPTNSPYCYEEASSYPSVYIEGNINFSGSTVNYTPSDGVGNYATDYIRINSTIDQVRITVTGASPGITYAAKVVGMQSGVPTVTNISMSGSPASGSITLGTSSYSAVILIVLNETPDSSSLTQSGYSVQVQTGTVPDTSPTVTNSTGASNITSTSARLNGEVTSTGGENPTVHIYWGPSNGGTTPGSWAHDVNLGVKAAGTFYTDISSLSPGTTYYYRCYAVNSAGSDWADATASFIASDKLIGADAGAPSTGAYSGNYFLLYRFQAVGTGNVVIFKIKTSASGNVKAAIYADNSGAPGALLSAVNTSTPVTTGWNSITITSTPVVTGNYYWLAYNSDSAIGYYYSTGGTLRYKTATYSTFTFPNPAGTGFSSLASNGLLAGWGFTVPPSAPTVTNSTGASNIMPTSARLNGEITSTGNENPTVHIYWGTSDGGTTPGSWAHDVNLGTKAAGSFYTDISSLTASTTYYYRCYAVNSGGGSWAASTASFATLPPPSAPTVTNSTGASSIMPTSARLNGEVTSTGGENPTVHIYWGPSNGGTTPGSWAHDVDLGVKAAGTFYTDISSLTPSTTYYYRCYATNSAGSDWADATASFATAAAPQKLIGVDAGAPSTGAYPGSYFFLYRFQAVGTGNVVIFKIKTSASGNVKAAIYADNSGAPGALLNAVNTSTPVVAGWNNITITSTSVVTGNYYWLAYNSDSAIGYYQSAGGTLRYKTTTYSTFSFPNPAGTGFSSLASNGLLAGWGFVVPPSAPTVTNSTSASNIMPTSARLNGEITDNGGENPTVHVYWGDNDGVTTPGNWDHDINLGVKAAGTFYTDISSLTASTTYYYRCYATNSAGSDWADATASFTTSAPPTAPTVTNSTGASSIMPTSARLNGEITATGGENPTVHIYWGPSNGGTTPGSWAHDVDLGAKAAGVFNTDISSLTPSTTYYYRCYATNSAGSDWADATASFATAAAPQKLIGVDAGAPSTGAYPGSYFFLYRFQAVGTGNVVIFKIKTSASGNVKVAIYADNSGAPGALLSAVNTSTPVIAGWNNITITSTSVVTGNYYWLAYNSDSAIGYYQSAGGTLRYKTATYSTFTFPNPAGTGFSSLASNGLLAGWGFVVPPTPPSAPTLVSPGAAITFKWNASTGATKYHLQVNTSSDFTGTNIFNAEVGDVTSKEVTGFTLGTTYFWRVKAGNAGGWSDWSSVRSIIASEVP